MAQHGLRVRVAFDKLNRAHPGLLESETEPAHASKQLEYAHQVASDE